MKKLLISFSGGETSAFMTWWIWQKWRDRYDIQVVFANTGEENEETLLFVEKFSNHFQIPVTWVEAVFRAQKGKGTTHRIVDFETATRGNSLFFEMAKIYGIPNMSRPHCNRELKLRPIKSFMRSIGWKDYETAIGIRVDEFDRMNENYKKHKLIYPLINHQSMTKQKINFWWSLQPFRLNLKGYQGNCKVCWKKSDAKLRLIAYENPGYFSGFDEIEEAFSGDNKYTFFRNNRSAKDFLESATSAKIIDDNANTNFQSSLFEESCDIFSMCGDK